MLIEQRPLMFLIGDRLFFHVSPINGMMRFGCWDKLSPNYISPLKILEIVREVFKS